MPLRSSSRLMSPSERGPRASEAASARASSTQRSGATSFVHSPSALARSASIFSESMHSSSALPYPTSRGSVNESALSGTRPIFTNAVVNDAKVARAGEPHPGAGGHAVDGRHDRLLDREDLFEQRAVAALEGGPEIGSALGGDGARIVERLSRAERLPFAGQHDRAHGVVALQRAKRREQRVEQVGGERV